VSWLNQEALIPSLICWGLDAYRDSTGVHCDTPAISSTFFSGLYEIYCHQQQRNDCEQLELHLDQTLSTRSSRYLTYDLIVGVFLLLG